MTLWSEQLRHSAPDDHVHKRFKKLSTLLLPISIALLLFFPEIKTASCYHDRGKRNTNFYRFLNQAHDLNLLFCIMVAPEKLLLTLSARHSVEMHKYCTFRE